MSAIRELSRRRRQLLATAVTVIAAIAVAATMLVRHYRSGAAATYRPGEENADITNSLARGLPGDAPTLRFVDVTEEAGLSGFRVFQGARASQLPEDMGSGAAWGDFDNDGDDDLFLVSAGAALAAAPSERAPSQLFENVGDGRFRLVTDFPDTRILGMGAAWGDVNGDGWLDLVVTSYGTILLFRNTSGHFALDARFASPTGFWTGAAFGDYDRDGDLDLYVCGYVQFREEPANGSRQSQHYGASVPYTLNPASYEPERNLLFRNNGNGVFRDVAHALGVDNPEGRSMSAVWHDFDADGWLDLYVANDISDNVMYRNVRGRFEDISHAAWVADYRGAMGLAVGDWNQDGDDDLFVSHWVAQENALFDSLLVDAGRQPAARPAVGGQGSVSPLRFVDTADAVGLGQIALPMVGWGAEFADFDADGWLDLVVANGSTFETDTEPRQLKPQLPFLFWNRRGEHFYNLAPLTPALAQPSVARGLAVADYDHDGDLDILMVRRDAGVQLLSNGMQRGHWLKLQLRSRVPGRPEAHGRGLGAQAIAYLGPTEIRRAVSPASYLSQSSPVLHFGLGDKTGIDRLEIRWASGATATFGGLAADRTWEITEGEDVPREVPGTATSTASRRGPSLPADDRSRTVAFWAKQREAMQALKVERDMARAAVLLREAAALDPTHEDTRYYLASCLATLGDITGALAELEALIGLNPSSHRALARWGALRAQTARGPADLLSAEASLQRAHELNPEETGALLALGEISLLLGDRARAEERLRAACTANPRAAGGLFLLGYLHWKRGDEQQATELLARTRAALGNAWKPHGSTAEGDVARKAHEDTTPLARFLDDWNGSLRAAEAYADLNRHLHRVLAGESMHLMRSDPRRP